MKICQGQDHRKHIKRRKHENTWKNVVFFVFLCFCVFVLTAKTANQEGIVRMALEPLDTYYTQQIYLSQIKANRAWNEIRSASDVIIAVLDTGVDIDHPDLINNIWVNKDEIPGNGLDDDRNGYIDDVNGWDFIADSPDPNPKFDNGWTKIAMNHGTVVAGVAAAEGGNEIGVAGLAWDAKIMPLRVLDGTGTGDTITVTSAINYARANGADIINLSFVGEDLSQSLGLALENAFKAGIFIVAAAGNEVTEGVDMDINPRYPVCQDGSNNENMIIGVGSVDNYDRKASFSNFGNNCLDINTPGIRIFSTQFYDPSQGFDKMYGSGWTGTSVSAPQVAGLAALVKAANPDISLDNWQQLVLDHADNIDNLNKSLKGQLGSGRLNAYKTALAAKSLNTGNNAAIQSFLVTGAGPGGGPHVRVFDITGNIEMQFFAYEPSFTGGVNAAIADMDNDKEFEIITAPQQNHSPKLKIFSKRGKLQNSFLAYSNNFQGGFKVQIADLNGDQKQDIITAPNKGGGPHIRVFTAEGKLISQFFAYNKYFTGGVNIAAADVDLDGQIEIITAPESGATSLVRIFDILGNLKSEFLAFDSSKIEGVSVSAWKNNILVGNGAGSKPLIKLFNNLGQLKKQWLAYDERFQGGVWVQIADINNDTLPEIITGPGFGGGPHLRIFNNFGNILRQWMAYNPGFRGGISIGVLK